MAVLRATLDLVRTSTGSPRSRPRRPGRDLAWVFRRGEAVLATHGDERGAHLRDPSEFLEAPPGGLGAMVAGGGGRLRDRSPRPFSVRGSGQKTGAMFNNPV